MKIRAYHDADWSHWLRLSHALFPQCSAEDLVMGMREHRARQDAEVFVTERGEGSVVGFVGVGALAQRGVCSRLENELNDNRRSERLPRDLHRDDGAVHSGRRRERRGVVPVVPIVEWTRWFCHDR